MMDEKKPYVKTGRVVAFDCDDTLIRWVPTGQEPPAGAVKLETWRPGEEIYATAIAEHVKCVKLHHACGDTVVVWSQGEAEWASRVVKALELDAFVDIIIGKPRIHYDDLPSTFWIGEQRHIPMGIGSVKSVDHLLKDDDGDD